MKFNEAVIADVVTTTRTSSPSPNLVHRPLSPSPNPGLGDGNSPSKLTIQPPNLRSFKCESIYNKTTPRATTPRAIDISLTPHGKK